LLYEPLQHPIAYKRIIGLNVFQVLATTLGIITPNELHALLHLFRGKLIKCLIQLTCCAARLTLVLCLLEDENTFVVHAFFEFGLTIITDCLFYSALLFEGLDLIAFETEIIKCNTNKINNSVLL